MYVIVVGGGKVGYYLSKKLLEEGHEVLLVEKDPKKSGFIREEIGDIVYQGDGCEMRLMKEMGMERADIVAAVTGDDEDNLVVCQLAKKKFNVKRVISRVNNPKNEEIFKKLGVDEIVNGTKIIYSLIDQEVDSQKPVSIIPLKLGNIEIAEIQITKNSASAGKKVKDITLPEESTLAAILRDGSIIFPRGETVLKENDTVFAFTLPDKEPALRKLLEGK